MIELPNEILLYHGSYMEVPDIDLSKCSDGLDFGKGFYLTTSFEQALDYIPATVKKRKSAGPHGSADFSYCSISCR